MPAAREEQRAVLLDLARLDGAQAGTGLLGEEAGAVHGAVDDGLVDVLVGPAAEQLAADADAVDDGVDARSG